MVLVKQFSEAEGGAHLPCTHKAPHLNIVKILLARKKARLPVGLLGGQPTMSPTGGDGDERHGM